MVCEANVFTRMTPVTINNKPRIDCHCKVWPYITQLRIEMQKTPNPDQVAYTIAIGIFFIANVKK